MLLEWHCSGPGKGGALSGVLLSRSSLWPSLVTLLLGEKEAREGLSGRGLVMSRCSCGRVLLGNLAWMPLEELLVVAPFMVGITIPRTGEPKHNEGSGTTGEEGLLQDELRELEASDPESQ